jgi:acyl dehydratase
MKYYEDIEVGETQEFGEYHVTKEEIIEFASKYDPQPFHTDEEAAKESAFGELVASGWHTAAICMRMLVEGHMDDRASMGARGVDELRWKQPVRPGDTLHLRTEVVDKRRSESDPRRGYVDNKMQGLNQDDEVVISWVGLGMIAVRDPESGDAE